jgi:hypothetical protein
VWKSRRILSARFAPLKDAAILNRQGQVGTCHAEEETLVNQLRAQCALAVAFCLGFAQTSGASGTVYNIPPDPAPTEIGAGDVVNLSTELFGGFMAGAGSTVNIQAGGGIGIGLYSRGEVNVLPGALGLGSWTLDGGVLHATGGHLGWSTVQNGGHVVVDGASMSGPTELRNSTAEFRSGRMDGVYVFDGSTMTIHSAGVLGAVILELNAELNIRGGGLAPQPPPANIPTLDASGQLNLFVRSAMINGSPIPGLTLGASVTIPERNVDLETVLADGTAYVVPLTPFNGGSVGDYTFHPSSIVTVTLVPEPASGLAATCAVVLAANLTRLRARRR